MVGFFVVWLGTKAVRNLVEVLENRQQSRKNVARIFQMETAQVSVLTLRMDLPAIRHLRSAGLYQRL